MSWPNRKDRGFSGSTGGRAELDRYEIIDELGQGGMSVVFRARDKQLGRDVAVKVLHDFLARQADARKRFHREAVAVARLRHPGIVEIHDYSGADAEDAFIVCEIIEGHTLRQFVDEHGAPAFPEFGALVIQELVRALRHAHEQGIVHRDVKPENVMITERGQLKLMDFGIAQIMEGATKLTATGTLLGSPAHMAPEVIDGKPSDHRSDIFSVGTMLYWLCTGQMPFSAPNPSALFRLILEGTYEPPQMINARIGNGLARIIERSLEPDPDVRYQDISQLQDDLQKELDEVELAPSDSVVKSFLMQPLAFSETWGPKMTETLAQCGKAALQEGNTGRAMDRFNRVLAIDPEHPDVSRMVSQIGRRQALNRRAKRALVGLAIAGLLGLLAYNEARLWPGTPSGAEPGVEVAAAPALAMSMAPPAPAAPPTVATPAAAPSPQPKARAPRPKIRAARAITARTPTAKRIQIDRKVPPPALKSAATTPAAADESKATLHVKIGPGFGHILINGQVKKEDAMKESFELTPGRYTVEMTNRKGRHAPRTLEIMGGQVFEIGAKGRRRQLRGNELIFRNPRPGETVRGWIPKPEQARGPSIDRGT